MDGLEVDKWGTESSPDVSQVSPNPSRGLGQNSGEESPELNINSPAAHCPLGLATCAHPTVGTSAEAAGAQSGLLSPLSLKSS